MDQEHATVAILEAGRRLGARGLISAGEGNLSIRLGDEVLCRTWRDSLLLRAARAAVDRAG